MNLDPPPEIPSFGWPWQRWLSNLYEWVKVNAVTDFALEVARGNVVGITGVNSHGTNLTVGTSFEDIWLQGGAWTKLPSATTLEVASSSGSDDAGSTGALTLTIEGLDSDYVELTETITMDGQTPVTTTGQFLFVNRAYVATGGTAGWNVGDIYIADDSTAWTSGVPNTATAVQAKISATQGETQQAIYTVPAGKTGYITNVYVVAGNDKVLDYELHETDHEAQSNRIILEGEETNTAFIHVYNPYTPVAEKHTISFDAKITSGSTEVSAGFDLYLVTN